jgi:hypothetical protein
MKFLFLLAYKKLTTSSTEEKILNFRRLLGKYFDFSSSRTVIYESNCEGGNERAKGKGKEEGIILQMKRRPFCSFLEKSL